ncbi:MAG: heme ABC exporter ATP-binding protein CcmA [Acidobacteriota bacterium]
MTVQGFSLPEQPSNVAIAASGLSRRFGRRWALADVSFRIPRGHAALVAGRNGSGKSTLFRLLSTAISPTTGTATIEGQDVTAETEEVRRRVAFLSHQANTYESLTALQNLEVFARHLGTDTGRDRLLDFLDEVSLAERAHDPISTFSAGMRKRLSIARLFLQDASVVMLDEPYAQLDPPGFKLIDRLFRKMRDRGTTVLLSTHLLERGAAMCDDGLLLREGRLVWTGPAAALPGEGAMEIAGIPEEVN